MLIVDALVVLGILSAVVWTITTALRTRAKRIEKREDREFQIKQLVAAKDVVQLLMLDEDNAAKVYLQLEKDLRAKGKLPPNS